MKRRIITSRMKRGSLIRFPLENIKRECFETIRKELKGILHQKSSIYALYYNDKLVYVGLATGLYGRLYGWAKSKHKRFKWNNFSIFIIKNIKYLRDLETAIVRIAKPKGNKIEGRVPRHHYLKRILKRKINENREKLNKKIKMKDTEIKILKKEISLIREAIE